MADYAIKRRNTQKKSPAKRDEVKKVAMKAVTKRQAERGALERAFFRSNDVVEQGFRATGGGQR